MGNPAFGVVASVDILIDAERNAAEFDGGRWQLALMIEA